VEGIAKGETLIGQALVEINLTAFELGFAAARK